MPIKRTVTARAAVVAALAIVADAACTQAGPIPPDGVLHINGMLTDEGIECPALRGDDGQLYTLTGDLAGASSGDAACVEGRLVEISVCQQGITVEIEKISAVSCAE